MRCVYLCCCLFSFFLAKKRVIDGQPGKIADEEYFLKNGEYIYKTSDNNNNNNSKKRDDRRPPEETFSSHSKKDNQKSKEHWNSKHNPSSTTSPNDEPVEESPYLGEYYPPSVDEPGLYLPLPGL
jgi:hypothetical protein